MPPTSARQLAGATHVFMCGSATLTFNTARSMHRSEPEHLRVFRLYEHGLEYVFEYVQLTFHTSLRLCFQVIRAPSAYAQVHCTCTVYAQNTCTYSEEAFQNEAFLYVCFSSRFAVTETWARWRGRTQTTVTYNDTEGCFILTCGT